MNKKLLTTLSALTLLFTSGCTAAQRDAAKKFVDSSKVTNDFNDLFDSDDTDTNSNSNSNSTSSNAVNWSNTATTFTVGDNTVAIPAYKGGEIFYTVNDNQPYFLKTENLASVSTVSLEFSPLDDKGRTGVANAVLGKEGMQTHKRGSISNIHPSGWYEAKESDINVNRSHLIGNNLAGDETDCAENMITGTRILNAGGTRSGVKYDGMLKYENQIADYMEDTGNHVRYRVTPVFDGIDVTPKGILMEAYSIEDHGKGIEFNIWVYNVDPDYECDYTTGEWSKITEPELTTTEDAE